MKFTDKYLQNLKPRAKVFDVRESDGFTLRVQPTGTKTFYYVYKVAGKVSRIRIGVYPAMKLADAHSIHRGYLDQRHAGVDPSAPIRPPATVATLCADYIERWAKPRKRQWETIDQRFLNKEVVPVIGHLPADQLHRRDVVAMLNAIVLRGSPASANQTLKILKRVFSFAVEQGAIEVNPIYMVKNPAPAVKKSRVLSDEEIKVFWQVISTQGKVSPEVRNLLKFILVTGQRPGECIGYHYEDVKDGWWSIPLAIDKTARHRGGKNHVTYLSPLAISLTRYQKHPYGVQIRSVSHCVRRLIQSHTLNIQSFTPHDLRRTAMTGMVRLGIPHDIAERVLGHSIGGVGGIYNRYDYAEEIRAALTRWGEHLEAITQ